MGVSRVPYALLPSGGRRSLRGRVAEYLAQANVMGTVTGRHVSPKRHQGLKRAHQSTSLRLSSIDLQLRLMLSTRRWSPEAWDAAARQRR